MPLVIRAAVKGFHLFLLAVMLGCSPPFFFGGGYTRLFIFGVCPWGGSLILLLGLLIQLENLQGFLLFPVSPASIPSKPH